MPDIKNDETPEDIQVALKAIVEHFEGEEVAVRQRQIRLWKKLEYYWSGFQRVHWNEVAHDWRVLGDDNKSVTLNEAAYYDKPINVYRALLESIIAALSATVPGIKCIPDDADNPLDISTAKGGDKIAELVRKHNDAQLLWCKALYIYCTQGMIAGFNYPDTNKDYGTVKKDVYEEDEIEEEYKVCPNCGMALGDDPIANALHESDKSEFGVGDAEVERDALENEGVLCVQCNTLVNPVIQKQQAFVQRLVGQTDDPKTRQCIDVNGGLFVRVPNYARTQKDTPYIAYCYETHFTNVFKQYPWMRELMAGSENGMMTSTSEGSGYELYERWGRLNVQYLGEYPANTPTVRNWWLRPHAFEFISDDKIREQLYKEYPDGCKVVLINEHFCKACNENLDDCWTLTHNPLAEYLTFDPLGTLVTSVQDITNDLTSLTLQTIEHGIPQTFADPNVLNFKQYGETEVAPGNVYPTKPKAGAKVGDGFHTLSTTSLGREVEPFADRIQTMGEFVSGAQPSLFGGAMPSSARTASQYQMSRNQSLQRLQTPWKMINAWWRQVFAKVIPAYIETMQEDERIVRSKHGAFVNDIIRRAELEGKIGSVEVESTDELPQTWSQIRDVIMQLIELNNPEVLAMIGSPENLELLRQGIGLTEFKIPGEDSRNKQYMEIQELVKAQPTMQMGPMGPIMMPSVMVEPQVDDNEIEAEICKSWLRSDAGQLAKLDNRPGYDNVTAHLMMHEQALMMQAMSQPSSNDNQDSTTQEVGTPNA